MAKKLCNTSDAEKAAESPENVRTEEVEHILMSHGGVLRAAVKSHIEGSRCMLEAVVTLKKGVQPSDELKSELAWHVAADLGENVIFKDIGFEAQAKGAKVPVPRPERGETPGVFISGHRIDPGEVGRILDGHGDVAGAVVTGVPDERKGELLKAHVTLEDGAEPSEELKRELAWYVQSNLGHVVAFREITFEGEPRAAPGRRQECMVIIDSADNNGGMARISGHKISTTEVTRALLAHPDISDAAVVSVPDDSTGDKMKAFVRLREGVEPTNDLKLDLAWFIATELKPVAVFKNIELGAPIPELAPEDVAPETEGTDSVDISGFTVLSDDVEDVLRTHGSVAEAVVIGVPDRMHGEVLEAFVSLVEGTVPSNELKEELAWHARTGIGPEVVFRSIKFRKYLPRTRNKKILRGIMKADALDLAANMTVTIAD